MLVVGWAILQMQENPDHRFSVAPMMDWTDRHCRTFHRCLTARAVLYTEMVTADAVIHGDQEKLIGYSDVEHPSILQLGGSDPAKLAEAARIGEDFGYDGINLNCGCPSDRVQSGLFGAILMQSPEIVADCVAAMLDSVSVPVSVKCRIGVDDDEPAQRLPAFVETVAASGCTSFAVHARKAWLKGLSPKENRDVPPLDYELVKTLKATHPGLTILLNGGIRSLEEATEHLKIVDGVMFGRAAYQTPLMLASIPQTDTQTPDAATMMRADFTTSTDIGDHEGLLNTALEAVEAYRPYMAARLAEGVPLNKMTRHMLGLFNSMPGARAWRRTLSIHAIKNGAGFDVFDAALAEVVRAAAEV